MKCGIITPAIKEANLCHSRAEPVPVWGLGRGGHPGSCRMPDQVRHGAVGCTYRRVKKNSMLIALAVILTVLLCTATVQAAEYFTTDGGVSVIPVFANTGAADTAMGTPVQGALIYSTSDGGIMYYDGSAWVSIENLGDGTAANNTLRWNGSDWVESTALTNDDTDITATGDVAVNGGDITSSAGTMNIANATPTTVNIAGAGTTVEIGATTGTTSVNNNLTVDGNTTIGNASGDTVTANTAAWTFANDTAVTLSGGVNGLNIDSDTLSVDGTNDRIGIGTAAPAVTLDISSATDAVDLPEGTTAQRPGTPAVGMIRYNSTTDSFEGYSGSTPAWVSLANALWEDGANGVFENDEAVIVGADAAFTYTTSGVGNLKIANNFEAGNTGFIGGDVVIGAKTSVLETLSNAGFGFSSNGDLFVAQRLGVEGNIYTDGDVDIAGGDITNIAGALTVTPNAGTNLNVNLSTTGDMVVNTDDLVVDTSAGSVGIGDSTPDAVLEILSTTAPQLKITHTEGVDDIDISVDANGDADIQISGDNLVIQNDTDGTTGVQILDADGGTPILNVDTTNERVGISRSAPEQKLDVNGTVKSTGLIVGEIGSTFSEIQSGTITYGNGSSGVNRHTLTFPNTFSSTPNVLCTIEISGDVPDTIACTASSVSTTSVTFNLYRLDSIGSNWGNSAEIKWIAWTQ